jgi:hypothetical protein
VTEPCGASLNMDGYPPWCGEPAYWLSRAMCVHEHYGEHPVCWGCMAGQRRVSGLWECTECASGPQPHVCPMPATFAPLAGVT